MPTSTKFRVVIDLDLRDIAPDVVCDDQVSEEAARDVFQNLILVEARSNAKRELHAIRRDAGMDMDVKSLRMAEQLRKIMGSLMAESNMTVKRLAGDHDISTTLPFENQYGAAQAA